MADDRLIVALDVPDVLAGLALADRLGDDVSFYKIGLGLLTGGGLALARELRDERDKRVFLDLKLFDIPQTIRSAVRGLSGLGLDFLTVQGDPSVVAAAAEGAAGTSTTILAVTFLTSSDRSDLDDAMIEPGAVGQLVAERARRAFLAGAGGVIASPNDAAAIRELPVAEGRLIVCPGVRPSEVRRDDQKRVATPAEAFLAGADHIVIGRPILAASDPVAATRAILDEIRT
jgi:orotidine-5'-phosphate decarboxylase